MTDKPRCAHLDRFGGWLAVLLPAGLMIGNAAAETVAGLLVLAFLFRSWRLADWQWLDQAWVRILLLTCAFEIVRGAFAWHAQAVMVDSLGWIRFVILAVALQRWILPLPGWQDRLISSGLLCLSWLTLDAIFQYLHGKDLFGHPILFPQRLTASYPKPIIGIMLAWQFLPYVMGDLGRGKLFRAVVIALLSMTTIVLSGERMALLFVLMSLVMVIAVMPALRRAGILLLLVFLLGMAGLMAAKPQIYQRQVTSTAHTIRHLADSPYGVIWRSAIDIIRTHPLVGIGRGNFLHECPNPAYGPDDGKHLGYSRCAPHPHNIYLEWMVDGGILALTGFVLAMVMALWRFWQPLRQGLVHDPLYVALLVTFLARLWPLSSSTSFFHGWSAIPFWITIGWGLARAEQQSSQA